MNLNKYNKYIENLFKKWEIVPIYLLLIFLGISTAYLKIDYSKVIAGILFIIITVWNLYKLYMTDIHPLIKKIETKLYIIYIIFLPIIIGVLLYPQTIDFEDIMVSSFLSFLISLLIMNLTLMQNSKYKNKIYFKKSFKTMTYILVMLYLVISGTQEYTTTIFSLILNHITQNTNEFITISLALVLLFATLSLVAYTYTLVEINENKDRMRKSGNYFFKSTILSIISLIFIFSTSYYSKISMGYYSLNTVLNIHGFIWASIFSSLVIISCITLFYCIATGIRGIRLSSKILKIGWHID